ACREMLSVVRSICTSRATVITAPTVPQIDARRACSKVNAANTLPRAITRKQASHAPANFSAAGRMRPLSRKSYNASRALYLRLGMYWPSQFFERWLPKSGAARYQSTKMYWSDATPFYDVSDRATNVLQRTTLEYPSGHPANSATRLKPAFSYIPGAWKS